MYAQEYSFYKRPDTSAVTWLTPQELDAIRMNRVLAPVKVREIPPVVRASTPDENTEAQNLVAVAPSLVARAIASGAIKQTFSPIVAPGNKGVHSKSTLRRHSLATRRVRSEKFWNTLNKKTQE